MGGHELELITASDLCFTVVLPGDTPLSCQSNSSSLYNNKEVCIDTKTNFHLFRIALSSLGVSQLIYLSVHFCEIIALTK